MKKQNKINKIIAAIILTTVVMAIVLVALKFDLVQLSAEFSGKKLYIIEGQSLQKEEAIKLAEEIFENSGELDIVPYVELASQMPVEEIIDFCANSVRNSFTANEAICLRMMALGKEDPLEIKTICDKINPFFCDELYSEDPIKRAKCSDNVMRPTGHKQVCEDKLPFWY